MSACELFCWGCYYRFICCACTEEALKRRLAAKQGAQVAKLAKERNKANEKQTTPPSSPKGAYSGDTAASRH
jgi:hypothetical protein